MAYDDFEDETIDKWTPIIVDGGTMVAAEAAAKFGNWGARITTEGAGNSDGILYENTEINGSPTFDVYTWIRTSDPTLFIHYYVSASVGNICRAGISADKFIYEDTGGFHDFTEVPSSNTWYRLRIAYDGTKINYYVYDANDDLLESHLDLTPGQTGNATKVKIYLEDGIASVITIDLDNTCYTDTPPPEVGAAYLNMKGYW